MLRRLFGFAVLVAMLAPQAQMRREMENANAAALGRPETMILLLTPVR